MASNISPEQLATLVTHLRQVNSCNVAGAAIMLFDYFLTLDREVALVWKSRWTISKVLFLISRYMPFFDVSVALYRQLGTTLSIEACKITYHYTGWMFNIGVLIAELIFTLRTWAVWEKNRALTYFLPTFFVGMFAAEFIALGLFTKSTVYQTSPILGCIFLHDPVLLFVYYVLLMTYDGTMLLLMIIRGITAFRNGTSHLIRVVYRDGILYYVYLFILSLLNILIVIKLPLDYFTLLVMMERVFHATLACRVILHIRQQATVTTYLATSEIEFGEVTFNR